MTHSRVSQRQLSGGRERARRRRKKRRRQITGKQEAISELQDQLTLLLDEGRKLVNE